MSGRVDRSVGAGCRIPEKDLVLDALWIKTLTDQPLLLLLEGLGVIERCADADEDRAGIGRQPAREMITEFRKSKQSSTTIADMPARPSAFRTSTP